MRRTDEDRFRIRPGKPRTDSDASGQRFTRQVLRAAQRASAGSGRPLTRGRNHGAGKGRGQVAARLAGGQLGPRSRRAIVKARLVVRARAAPGSTAAHLRYIQRDSVTREGERGRAYSAGEDLADIPAFETRIADDRHEFRFIVSPEDAAEFDDLKGYTRDLMHRMEADLGSRLDWVAVDHWDTDSPHTHVVLRGVDETGADLVIARDYISHGLRARASELATEWLGPQTERDIAERFAREVDQERWTGLDRTLSARERDGVVELAAIEGRGSPGQGTLVGRVKTLQRLGLAEEVRAGVWRISSAAEPTLRAMGERGDIIRTMQRALGSAVREKVIHDPAARLAPVVGRVAAKGLADELADRGYLVVDGVDGRAHYVTLPERADLANYPVGGIVEVRSAEGPRVADRTIARTADNHGIYRVDRHLAEARLDAKAGDDPTAFVAAHVRRLEALRRDGVVERLEEGRWRLPPDFLARAAAHEASRGGSVAVDLRSQLDLGKQARAIGATWLDRALIDGTRSAPIGFGAEVARALEGRRAFLEEQGLATRHGQRLILARDLLATLRARDVDAAGKRLAGEFGLEHRPVRDSGRVAGIYRRSVMLTSGRFAMLDDGVGFSLVPWKPVVEQRLGQSVSAVMRGGSVSWDLSRQRGIGV